MEPAEPVRVDVRGVCCPLPLIKLARAIQELGPGQTLEIIGNDPIFEPSIRDYCKANGHELLVATPGEQHAVSILIRVGK